MTTFLLQGSGTSNAEPNPCPCPDDDVWTWFRIGAPRDALGDEYPLVSNLLVDPRDDRLMYVGVNDSERSQGLFITRDGGWSWENPFQEPIVFFTLAMSPSDPDLIYAALYMGPGCAGDGCLYRSIDAGLTWQLVFHTEKQIARVAFSQADHQTLFLGTFSWLSDADGPGIFICHDPTPGGVQLPECSFSPFDLESDEPYDQQLMVWDIVQDPRPGESFGTIFAITERNHPGGGNRWYPPFMRSNDLGQTWQRLTMSPLPIGHGFDLEFDEIHGVIYFNEEHTAQFYVLSGDGTATLRSTSNDSTQGFLLDRTRFPSRLNSLYAGSKGARCGSTPSGVRHSDNYGHIYSWRLKGLCGRAVHDLKLNGSGHKLFAAAHGDGIWATYMDYCPPGVTDDGAVDTDGDGLGDACDLDIDGDGIPNEFDCAPRNRCLGPDIDQDGVCDGWGTHPETGLVCDLQSCLFDCGVMYGRLGPAAFHLGRCMDECGAAFDKCIPEDPATDPHCGPVVATCLDVRSPVPCDRVAAAACAMRYGNPSQDSTFGDLAVGDKCKTGIGELSLYASHGGSTGLGSGLPVTMSCQRYGDTYSVDMRLWGGEVAEGPSGEPRHEVESRTAVEVGACSCTPGNQDGWDPDCIDTSCPYSAENNVQDEKAWNPLSAPEIEAKRESPITGHEPIYPV